MPVVICTCKHNLTTSDLPGDETAAGRLVDSVTRKSRRISFQRLLCMSSWHQEYPIVGQIAHPSDN